MTEFVSKALDDELHPKTTIKEEKYMGNMRTMAFQVPEDLFQQIKDYLDRHHMTQKQFVLGLIQDELDRDYEEQQAMADKQQSEDEPDEDEDEDFDETEDEDLSEEDEELEDEDEDEDLDESEDPEESEGEGMSMDM